MNLEYLRSLKRSELQKLAREHGVRANLKSTKIIEELLEKNPPAISPPGVHSDVTPAGDKVDRDPAAPSPPSSPLTRPPPLATPLPLQTTFSSLNRGLGTPNNQGREPTIRPRAGRSNHPATQHRTLLLIAGPSRLREEAVLTQHHYCSPTPANGPQPSYNSVGVQADLHIDTAANPLPSPRTPSSSAAGPAAGPELQESPPNGVGHGEPAAPEDAPPRLASVGGVHRAIATFRHVSFEHDRQRLEIAKVQNTIAKVKDMLFQARRAVRQERGIRMRLETYLSYWHEISNTWEDKDVYGGEVKAVKYHDGRLQENFDKYGRPRESSPTNPVENVIAKASDLYGLNLQSDPIPKGGSKKRTRDQLESQQGSGDCSEAPPSPLSSKRARVNVAGSQAKSAHYASGPVRPVRGTNSGDSANVLSMLMCEGDSSPPSRSIPQAGPSVAHDYDDSSPPRLTAAQKGKGRARSLKI